MKSSMVALTHGEKEPKQPKIVPKTRKKYICLIVFENTCDIMLENKEKRRFNL